VTVPFDLVNPKSIEVLSSLSPIRTVYMKDSSQENEGKPFFTKVTFVTLTFDLKKTKTNRGQALTKTNTYVKYETYVVNISECNGGNHYFTKIIILTLIFDLINSMSIWVMSLSRTISM